MSNPEFSEGQEGIFFDLDKEQYHRAPGVSKSMLWAFGEAGSPKHYQDSLKHPKPPTSFMEMGTILHTAILEPHLNDRAYHVRPDNYTNEKGEVKPWHGAANFCKQWEARHEDRPVIKQSEADRIPFIVESVSKLPHFGPARLNGRKEVSFFKRDDKTGILLKCRPDLVATAADGATWLFDPKKVQSGEGSEKAFGETALKLGYHVQAASYLAITEASGFVFVPFDDDTPYDCAEWPLKEDFLEMGHLEWRLLLLRFKWCSDHNTWPGYQDMVKKLPPPKWAAKRLADLREAYHAGDV